MSYGSRNKPVAKIGAKLRNAERGTKATPILAVWKGQYGYTVSVDTQTVDRIVLKDGTEIRGGGREGTHWLDLFAFEPLEKSATKAVREQAAKDDPLVDKYDDYGGAGGDDSIPFAEREGWGS